ncbi:hypothetical protein THRCLA_21088 [Thraustotheca clavata]|uniref:Uncharacterized protein n=1 Tax=Thraustotheca clavata TaxID=74557 RepID=A0A1W0A120_9STRA|nr:hypothetical protein THRCLA_21088 [Thraustotheca clavata]
MEELEIKFNEKSREVFEESSSEFINKGLQIIKKIDDYDESKMDVYGRLPKGNFLALRKTDYYYTYKFNDPKLFLNEMFAQDEMYHLCSSKDSNELINFIKSTIHPQFPFIELNYDFIGFTNEVYNLSIAEFLEINDVPKTFKLANLLIKNSKLSTPRYLISIYHFNLMALKFANSSILRRCLTRLDDKFDFMMMIKGQGGSVKSLLANLIKYSFRDNQVWRLSALFHGIFGLSEFANKQIVYCDDMPHNIAKTLPRSFFLTISCPVKGKTSIDVADWNLPTIINSNHMPNYKDESGEIV